MAHVYTAGRDETVRKLRKSDGVQVWSFGTGTYVDSVCVDPAGNVYVAQGDAPNEVIKINAGGTEVWRRSPYSGSGATGFRHIAVDADGAVFVACNNFDIYKIAPDGASHVTFATLDYSAFSVAVGHDGNIYACGPAFGGLVSGVNKFNAAGSLQWKYNPSGQSWGSIAVDLAGNVYASLNDGTALHKIDAAGDHVWTFTAPSGIRFGSAVAVDADGSVYVSCASGATIKVDSAGSQVWIFEDFTDQAIAVDVDPSGNVFATGDEGDTYGLSPAGSELWENTGHTGGVFGVAADPGKVGAGFWPAASNPRRRTAFFALVGQQ